MIQDECIVAIGPTNKLEGLLPFDGVVTHYKHKLIMLDFIDIHI